MSEREDRREDRDDDEDLQELKRRRSRHDDDDEPRRGRNHKAQPKIEKFQIWFQMGNSTVTADYTTEGDFDASDLERFVDDLISDDFRLYRKQTYKKDRGGSGNYGGGYNNQRGGRSSWRGRNYED